MISAQDLIHKRRSALDNYSEDKRRKSQASPPFIRRGKVLLRDLVQVMNGEEKFATKKFGSIDTNIPTSQFNIYKRLVTSKRPVSSCAKSGSFLQTRTIAITSYRSGRNSSLLTKRGESSAVRKIVADPQQHLCKMVGTNDGNGFSGVRASNQTILNGDER